MSDNSLKQIENKKKLTGKDISKLTKLCAYWDNEFAWQEVMDCKWYYPDIKQLHGCPCNHSTGAVLMSPDGLKKYLERKYLEKKNE